MNFSDQIAEILTERQLDLNRLTGTYFKQIRRLLKDIMDDVESKFRGDLSEYQTRRLQALQREIKAIVTEQYGVYYGDIEQDLIALAKQESEFVVKAFNESAGGTLMTALAANSTLEAIVQKDPIQGAPLKDWFKRQAEDTQNRIMDAIRLGAAQSETNGQIVRRLRGLTQTTVGRSVEQASRANLNAIVRTAVQTVAANASDKTYEANSEIFSKWEHISTLDSRTTVQCAVRDGLTWDYQTREPIGHKVPFQRPPIHWSCRSRLMPITKSFRELGFDVDDFKPSTRASMDGQVSAGTDFNKFLDKKGPEFADEVLGKGRADLYREGKITFTQLLDPQGNPLSLAELQRKYGN